METKEKVMAAVKGNTAVQQTAKKETVKSLIESANIKGRFQEMLGKRAPQFISSVISLVNSDTMLAKASPHSVIFSAAMAATLDLPVNKNLGFAFIIGYNTKQPDGSYQVEAQFQMGYKGYIQLALRSGQYRHINVAEVYEGQVKSFNRVTEAIEFDWTAPDTGNVMGYVAYFELINGFEKTVYWPKATVEAHKIRYVKAKSFSPWITDYDKMAKKTVLKNTIATWGILSVDMQRALVADEGTPTDLEGTNTTFSDISDTPEHAEIANTAPDQSQPETTSFEEVKDDAPAPQSAPVNNNPTPSIF